MQKHYKLTIGLLALILGTGLEAAEAQPATRAAVAALRGAARDCAVKPDNLPLGLLQTPAAEDSLARLDLARRNGNRRFANALCVALGGVTDLPADAQLPDLTAATYQAAKRMEVGSVGGMELESAQWRTGSPKIDEMLEKGEMYPRVDMMPYELSANLILDYGDSPVGGWRNGNYCRTQGSGKIFRYTKTGWEMINGSRFAFQGHSNEMVITEQEYVIEQIVNYNDLGVNFAKVASSSHDTLEIPWFGSLFVLENVNGFINLSNVYQFIISPDNLPMLILINDVKAELQVDGKYKVVRAS